MAENVGLLRRNFAMSLRRSRRMVAVAAALLTSVPLMAQTDSKTVVGPRNIYLADGAAALFDGDAERGIELTLQALEFAHGGRERKYAHANLCAGYVMLEQPTAALEHCNWVIEKDANYWRGYNNRAIAYLQLGRYDESEADIARGQELRPKSVKLKTVKGMLLDETDPVNEMIEIDERRGAMDDDEEPSDSDSE